MKKSINTALLIACCSLMTSCSSDDLSNDKSSDIIRLSSGLTVTEGSRAKTDLYTSTFSGGEKIDVYISETSDSPTTTYDQPLVYTVDSNDPKNLTTTKSPYWPSSGNGVNIYAFYPSGTVNDVTNITTTDFTVKADQTADADYQASDLMYAVKGSERTSDAVNLEFDHLLSKVTITLKQGTGSPDLAKAKVRLLKVKPSTTIKVSSEAVGIGDASGTAADLPVISDNSTSALTTLSGSCIIPPQTLANEFVEVELNSGGTFRGTLSTGAPTLDSGKEYKYTITVNLTGLEITGTIKAWNENDEQNGEAKMKPID